MTNKGAIGKSFQDRERSAKVRNLALDQIEEVLKEGKLKGLDVPRDFQFDLLLKLAGNVLPRLNEHSGEDGSPIIVKVINYGDHNSVPVPTEEVSSGVFVSSTAV